jgi:hypothetical protein
MHLRNRVTQSHQIATRRFGSATGRVTGKFFLVQSEQQGALLPHTLDCSQMELFFRLHALLYRVFREISSSSMEVTRSRQYREARGDLRPEN